MSGRRVGDRYSWRAASDPEPPHRAGAEAGDRAFGGVFQLGIRPRGSPFFLPVRRRRYLERDDQVDPAIAGICERSHEDPNHREAIALELAVVRIFVTALANPSDCRIDLVVSFQ